MISNTNKIYFGNQQISKVYVGDNLVFGGETAWTPYSLGSSLALWLDATDTDTITLNGSNVSQWDDKSDNQLVVTQSVADQQPAYTTGEKVTFDRVNDTMTVTMPATTGTLVLATANGTAAYGVNIPAGAYSIGGHNVGYMPDGPIIGQIVTSTAMSEADKSNAIAWLREKGGGNNYATVTNFSNWWRNWTELTSFPLLDTSNGTNFSVAWYNCTGLTSFPLIDTSNGTNFQYSWVNCTSLTSFPLLDTSNGTNFQYSWYKCSSLTSFPLIDTSSGTSFQETWNGCSSLTSFPLLDTSSGTNFREAWSGCTGLTSFPLIDTSSGTNFPAAWYGCTSLASFPANFFDNCLATNFTNAFTNTNLSQQSIDNILVSIESNGTSNGTFTQSGGSAPSATGNAAITALRNRGWSITVTGGF
jgi:hypothetical protein